MPNIGNNYHIGHKEQNCLPALDKDLNDKDMNLIKDMGEGKAPPGMIQTSIFNKTGHIVSKSAIRHITNYNKQNIMNDSDFELFFKLKPTAESSTTEYMMKYCRKHGYIFQLLLHDPIY